MNRLSSYSTKRLLEEIKRRAVDFSIEEVDLLSEICKEDFDFHIIDDNEDALKFIKNNDAFNKAEKKLLRDICDELDWEIVEEEKDAIDYLRERDYFIFNHDGDKNKIFPQNLMEQIAVQSIFENFRRKHPLEIEKFFTT